MIFGLNNFFQSNNNILNSLNFFNFGNTFNWGSSNNSSLGRYSFLSGNDENSSLNILKQSNNIFSSLRNMFTKTQPTTSTQTTQPQQKSQKEINQETTKARACELLKKIDGIELSDEDIKNMSEIKYDEKGNITSFEIRKQNTDTESKGTKYNIKYSKDENGNPYMSNIWTQDITNYGAYICVVSFQYDKDGNLQGMDGLNSIALDSIE